MAAHIEPPFSNDQIAWLDQRIAEKLKASVRHCSLCGTSPLARVVACIEVDCPAREAQAA
jgi:hypothetical protein